MNLDWRCGRSAWTGVLVLGLEEVLEDVAEEGSLALAEVLALGGLAVTVAGCTGGSAGDGAGG